MSLLSNESLLRVVKHPQKCLIAAIAIAGLSLQAQAQLQVGNPIQMSDNVANQGSPTVIYAGADSLYMYYVNHSNNTIYVDEGSPVYGLDEDPISTGIVVNSAELTDVGITQLSNGTFLICYVGTNNQVDFATSADGISFGVSTTPSSEALGLPNSASPNIAFVPTLLSSPTQNLAYVATVGSDGYVYMSYTSDGVNFTPLNGSGVSVSAYTTVSRPSLAWFQSAPWVGFTTSGVRYAVIGNALSAGIGIVASGVVWGNNHRNGHYAGLGLLSINNILYAFGQDYQSSQHLKYIFFDENISNPTWSDQYVLGNQMRWTPSLTYTNNGSFLVYQDDGNTNISEELGVV